MRDIDAGDGAWWLFKVQITFQRQKGARNLFFLPVTFFEYLFHNCFRVQTGHGKKPCLFTTLGADECADTSAPFG